MVTAIFIALLLQSSIFVKAIDYILVDEGFTIPSTLVQKAREIARHLKSWCELDENKVMVNEFAPLPVYISAFMLLLQEW